MHAFFNKIERTAPSKTLSKKEKHCVSLKKAPWVDISTMCSFY